MEITEPAKKETKNEILSTAKDLVELLGKVILGGLALCYGLGLVMVNLYYSRYGVYSLSLFRLNYVIAGLWVLLPLISMSVVVFGLVLIGASVGPQNFLPTLRTIMFPNKSSRFLRATMSIGLVAFTIELHVLLMPRFGITLNSEAWILLVSMSFCVVSTVALTWYGIYKRREPHRISVLILGVFGFFLLYVFVFSRVVYERIPAHLGGGGIKDVQLLLDVNELDKKFFELSGLRFYENLNWTKTTKLLFTTDDECIFLVKPPEWEEGSTLSIKKDLIKSILYQGLRGGGGGDSFDSEEPTASPSPPVTPANTSPSPAYTSPSPSPSP